MIIVIAFVIFLLFLWDKLGFKDSRIVKCANQFPGPLALPIIGNSFQFINFTSEDVIPLIKCYFENHGDTMRVWILNFLAIISKDPRFFEAILSNRKQLTKHEDYDFLREWLGNGLLLSTGQKWFNRRKIITPTFHFKILQQFVDIFNQQSGIFVKQLKEMKSQEPFDIYNMVTLMSLDIICQTAMGVELNSQVTNSEYAQTVREMTRIVTDRMSNVWKRSDVIFNLTSDRKRHEKCLEILHNFTKNVIEQRRRMIVHEDINLKHIEDNSVGSKRKLAFLDVLLKSTINGQPLTNADIAEEVDTFMFEGHDTTASAISFAFYLLSRHPEVQQKVFEEVTRIVGSDPDTYPTYNQLMDMKYLECCIKESLRLYPPISIIGRKLDEDLNFNNILITAGVNVNLSIFHLNRDPKYFPNPDEFNPDRFYDKVSLNENAFVYVPFSAGPRNCIGQKFAMLEMKSTICNVVRNFELVKGNVDIKLMFLIVLKSSSGVHVGFKARQL